MKKKLIIILVFSILLSSTYAVDKFGYKVSKEDAFLYTQGNIYLIQATSIICSGNMLYFAAKDFTAKKDLLVAKTEKIDVTVDEKDRKVLKITFSLKTNKKIYPEYKLVVYGEIRREFPFLAIYSKFLYLGKERHLCGINWGLSSAYEKFKYYTIPQKGKPKTFKLVKTRKTKIGHADWIFINNGKGVGAGLIAPAVILGKGEDFIFVNSVPPKKRIKKGESIDVFMIFMPINKNWKTLPELFNKIKKIKWEYK